MVCNKSKLLMIEEMNILIAFIENENAELEKEKNELKMRYHLRPPEERNIMKDILTMHNEFEQDLLKLKEIAECFSKVPSNKNQIAEETEGKIEELVDMQEEMIEFYETIQKLLIKRANYQIENDKLNEEFNFATEKLEEKIRIINEIKSYDDINIYKEKADALKNECMRLNDLIVTLDDTNGISFNGIQTTDITTLSERKATSLLHQIGSMNLLLEREINENGDIISKIDEEKELKAIIDNKKLKNNKKREILNKLLDDVNEEEKQDDYTKKMKILDKIIGIKTEKNNILLRPKSKLAKNTLLDDIEESLNRARAIASPNKFK